MPSTSLAERYPTLQHLFSSYFHQDWTLEAPTTAAAVRQFTSDEGATVAQRAAGELERLLAELPKESDLATALDALGCYYTPAAEGVTRRTWLTRVGQVLLAAG